VPNSFLLWLLRTSWQISILILLVGLIQWIFRRQLAPRWRYILWLLVVVRLIVPFSLPSPFSLFNFLHLKPAAVLNLPFDEAVSPVSIRAENQSDGNPSSPKQPARSGKARPTFPARIFQKTQDVPFLLLGLWLIGAVTLAVRIIGQDLRFASRVGRTKMVTDPHVLQILDECRRGMKIRFPVPLLETQEVETPALYGPLHPRLLIPIGMAGNFSDRELRHIFLHELAHVKRNDLLFHWLTTVAQVVHWFNPFVWVGVARMQVERELACDAMALSQEENQENESYGQTLLKMLEQFVQPRLTPGVVGFLEKAGPIKERISMIAHFKYRKASRWRMLAALPLFLFCAIALTDAQTSLMNLSGIVSWWSAEGNANDSLGRHAGSLKGNATFRPGVRGAAFDFNGVDQFVEVIDSNELSPKGSFSISAWIYPRQDRQQTIIAKWADFPDELNNRSYSIEMLPELGLRFAICDLKNQWNPYFHKFDTQFEVLALNAWNHVVAVYDQTTGVRQMYVDGIKVAERIDPPINVRTSTASVSIGATLFTAKDSRLYFDGMIDEVGFYSRTLSADEVLALYHAGLRGNR
jgi:beta-lactamase regulating signal transducer with metallopeptidase domain